MQATRISDRRVWIVTLISAAGWGLSWFICLWLTIGFYFERSIPLQGAIAYDLGFGFIGITVTLIGLWIVRVRLPLTHIIILYAAWGICTFALGILAYSGDLSNASNSLINLSFGHIFIFGVTLSWMLVQSVDELTGQDGLKMGLGWIVGIGLPLMVIFFTRDFYYWMFFTPIAIFVTCILGSRATFWRIQRLQNDRFIPADEEMLTPAALGQLMQSSAQQATFEVVHDSGKPKAKRKPKHSRWPALSKDLYLFGRMVVAALLVVGIFTVITPAREVRVEVVVTPTPMPSTPLPVNIGVPATPFSRTLSPAERAAYPATSTPITGVIKPGDASGYHISAYHFDGVYWQYTLQAANGNSETVDASAVNPEIALTPTLNAPFMDKVGTMQTDLVTREKVGDIPSGSHVQLIRIIWFEGKAPVYLITPDVTSPQIIVADASAEQLDYAAS